MVKCRIEFELDYPEPIDPNFEMIMRNIFLDWDGGRRQFDAEMIIRGLRNCIENAMRYCCEKAAHDKYGHETVRTSPTSETSRWGIESEKEWEKLRKRLPTLSNLQFKTEPASNLQKEVKAILPFLEDLADIEPQLGEPDWPRLYERLCAAI